MEESSYTHLNEGSVRLCVNSVLLQNRGAVVSIIDTELFFKFKTTEWFHNELRVGYSTFRILFSENQAGLIYMITTVFDFDGTPPAFINVILIRYYY